MGALNILEQLGTMALSDRYPMEKNCVVLVNPYFMLRHM
jgi:hypothetical protein